MNTLIWYELFIKVAPDYKKIKIESVSFCFHWQRYSVYDEKGMFMKKIKIFWCLTVKISDVKDAGYW